MSESKGRRIYFCLKANFSGKKIEAETWNERQPSSQRKRQSHNFQTENFTPTTEKKKGKKKKTHPHSHNHNHTTNKEETEHHLAAGE